MILFLVKILKKVKGLVLFVYNKVKGLVQGFVFSHNLEKVKGLVNDFRFESKFVKSTGFCPCLLNFESKLKKSEGVSP